MQTFFQQVIGSLSLEGNYLILLARDAYDVPYRSRDGERQDDASAEVFSYLLCAVCPVKQTKPGLSYHIRENEFCTPAPDWLVSAPELGFLFPAFDERTTNLYNALYYTRDTAENHPEVVDALFRSPIPMPASAQKETFQSLLGDTLGADCSLEVVQAVQEQLCQLIQEHKECRQAEPLTLSKGAVTCVLRSCGVSDRHAESFDGKYDEAFGPDAALSPGNLVDTRQLELRTPDVTIRGQRRTGRSGRHPRHRRSQVHPHSRRRGRTGQRRQRTDLLTACALRPSMQNGPRPESKGVRPAFAGLRLLSRPSPAAARTRRHAHSRSLQSG